MQTLATWISFKKYIEGLPQFVQSWALPTANLYSTCSVKCYRCWSPLIVCDLWLIGADRGCSSWHTRLFSLCDVAEPGRLHMDHRPRVSQRRLTCWQWLWCESNLRTFAGTSRFIFSYRKQHFITVREFLGVNARLEEDRFWASNQMVHSMGVGVKWVKFDEIAGHLVKGVASSHLHATKTKVVCDIINWNTYMLMAVAGSTEEEAKTKVGDVLDFALQSELQNAKLSRKQLFDFSPLQVFQHTALGKLCSSVLKKWNAELGRNIKSFGKVAGSCNF